MEQPISFFSEGLKDYELKYNYVEKQVIIVMRALKKFRHMLSNNKIQLLVPHANVKDFLLNKDIGEKRVGRITKVMEYDHDIKITRLVRRRGVYENFNSSFGKESKTSLLLQEEEQVDNQGDAQTGWLEVMYAFLRDDSYPPHFDRTKRSNLRFYSIPYALVDGILFKRSLDGVLLKCIQRYQTNRLLEFHNGPSSGHFSTRTTTMKIMRAGYY